MIQQTQHPRAADVLAFMDAAGLPAATVVGHSMGSFIAQRVASIAPRRVEQIILESTSPALFDGAGELNAAVQELTDQVPDEFIREFQASTVYRPLAEPFFETLVAESKKLPLRVWKATIAGWPAEERWADPARLTMPVPLFWGDKDTLMPRAYQDVFLAAVPHARLAAYEGTGHGPHWEEPERFVRDLEGFIRDSRPVPAK